MDCAALESLTEFTQYVATLRNVTDQETNLTAAGMQPCRVEICSTLYGTGNSDVSGIGVIVAYFLEFTLALGLGALLTAVIRKWSHERPGGIQACRAITAAFADSAIALTLSVELASAIMLMKKNLGLGSYDFGGLTIQIVWIVALLVILPVVPFAWLDLRDHRFKLRFSGVTLSMFLFFVSFVCRMVSHYSPGHVSNEADAAMSPMEHEQVQFLCFAREAVLSRAGNVVTEICSIAGSLWVCCSVVFRLIDLGFRNPAKTDVSMAQRLSNLLKDERTGVSVHLVIMFICSVPLFWSLMILREEQGRFAQSLGVANENNIWSFGQIIAVVVFMPVLNEVLYQCVIKSDHAKELEPTIQSGSQSGPSKP